MGERNVTKTNKRTRVKSKELMRRKRTTKEEVKERKKYKIAHFKN